MRYFRSDGAVKYLVGLVLFGAVAAFPAEKPMSEKDQARFKKLAESLRTLKDAEAVFYRVDPVELSKDADPKTPQMHGYAILEEKKLSAVERDEIAAILAKESTYADVGAKCFDPGMALRFRVGTEQIDVVICLECHWAYWYGKEDPALALSAEGRKELGEFYKKFFPPVKSAKN